ncbi:MAG TPA: glycosyltransferase family 2 protein [Candidatus Acidoferrales bacterium]|nr:glycosyltransferase family 2 protein [Candidatus Acidoferrales bacterium]
MKTLAAIVLSWNGLALTRDTLVSLARSRMPRGWRLRVIVVDNASSDGSPAAIAAEFPDVELVALGENRRFAGGNNAGLARALEAGDDAVVLLNNDVQADPGMLEKLLAALAERPDAGAAAPLIYHAAPGDLIWYAGGRCVPALAHTSHRGLRRRDRGQYRSVEETGYLSGCCLLATAEAWRRVGLLDERYFIYAEDADWSLRARAAGYRLLFVPTARLWHQVSASSGGGANPWKIYQRLRANVQLFARHARGPARWSWPLALLAQQGAFGVWLAARGRFAAAAAVPRALWDAARDRDPAGVQP